jgi:hypothetical protein
MKNLFKSFVFLLLVLSGCSTLKSISPFSSNDTPTDSAESKKNKTTPSITLVIGGAGMASFAAVGFLKKLEQEKVRIDSIITTGSPSVFALAFAFTKSAHDLEWFAMRLQEKDFRNLALLERDSVDEGRVPTLVSQTIGMTNLNQSKVPVIIADINTDHLDPTLVSTGSWKLPLLKTSSIPGLYREFPFEQEARWISTAQALDTAEAGRRGAKVTVVLNCYEDFIKGGFAKKGTSPQLDQVYFRKLEKSLQTLLPSAQVTSSIILGSSPTDFSTKRKAILAGYREATQVIQTLKSKFSE